MRASGSAFLAGLIPPLAAGIIAFSLVAAAVIGMIVLMIVLARGSYDRSVEDWVERTYPIAAHAACSVAFLLGILNCRRGGYWSQSLCWLAMTLGAFWSIILLAPQLGLG